MTTTNGSITLEEGTVYLSDPLKLTHEEENPEMDLLENGEKRSAQEKLEKWPERHVRFKVDYSGLTVEDLMHQSFTQTAAIDKLRQRFRTMDTLEEAVKLRESHTVGEDGHPIWECKYEDLLPKRARRRPKVKSLAEYVDGLDSVESIQALMDQLKEKMNGVKK